jgi:hypothetical protein
MAVIAFQVFIKHMAVIARRILKYAQMSSRAVLHVEGMYFSDCKNETKQKNKRRYLVSGNLNEYK